jgi:hypothetical protein
VDADRNDLAQHVDPFTYVDADRNDLAQHLDSCTYEDGFADGDPRGDRHPAAFGNADQHGPRHSHG